MSLRIDNLSAWHGQAQVLWDISMEVPAGSVVGVLGRNGAGKTTLLRAIAGLHAKTSGAIVAHGKRIAGLRADVIARHGVALLREGGRLPASLSVLDNLILGQRLGWLRGTRGRPVAEVWKWFPILEPLQERTTGLLSGGQRQALALACAFIGEPTLMLLDEPSAGLAPPVAKDLFGTIRQLAQSGMTILVVEQQPAWLFGLTQKCYLLEIGRIAGEDTVENLVQSVDRTA